MNQPDPDTNETDGEIHEPENSTVDDWFGQNVARDQDVADAALESTDSVAEAEAKFDREADGEDRYREGHPPPDGPREGEKASD